MRLGFIAQSFPQWEWFDARKLRHIIDDWVDDLVVHYGDNLNALADSLLTHLLLPIEGFFRHSPWWSILFFIFALAFSVSKRFGFALSACLGVFAIGLLGLWDEAMQTLALMVVAVLITTFIGIPLGVLMSQFTWLRKITLPILDMMQTMPTFVYLIPIVMLFGLGKVPAIFATAIYALPPLIRLTDLGIRLVDSSLLEASRAFGASRFQTLTGVQLPLALPTIFAGINQMTMLALSMAVVASMIGAGGLGQQVLIGINRLEVGRGLLAGSAIVILAIVLDRITQQAKLLNKANEHFDPSSQQN